jgi:hypothetical protein
MREWARRSPNFDQKVYAGVPERTPHRPMEPFYKKKRLAQTFGSWGISQLLFWEPQLLRGTGTR